MVETEEAIPRSERDFLREYTLEEIWRAYDRNKKRAGRRSGYLETPHDIKDKKRIDVVLPYFLSDALKQIRKNTYNSYRLATCFVTKMGIVNLDQIDKTPGDRTPLENISLPLVMKKLIDTKEALRKINAYFDIEDDVILVSLERREPLWKFFPQVKRHKIPCYNWVAGAIANFASDLGISMEDAALITICIGLSRSQSNNERGEEGFISKIYIKKIYRYFKYLEETLGQELSDLEENSVAKLGMRS